MATPGPAPTVESIDVYRAKLVKMNTEDLTKRFRKVCPEVTEQQITALGRQGMIDRLVELREIELAQVAAPAAGVDPMMQMLQMMIRQQKAAEDERKAERKAAEDERRLRGREGRRKKRRNWPLRRRS